MENSAPKTTVTNGAHGWVASTLTTDKGGQLWKITTIKNYQGLISSTAKKMLSENSFMVFGNPKDTKGLIKTKGRATEKTISEQHAKAVILFDEQDESKEGDKEKALNPIKVGLKFFTWFNTGNVWQVITSIEGDQYTCVYLKDLSTKTDSIHHLKPYSKKFGIGSYYYDETEKYGELEYYTADQIANLLTEVENKQRAEQEQADRERKETQEKIDSCIDKIVIPSWAESVIVAELQKNESDPYTDYFSSRTVKTVYLGFSKNTRRNFAELQKACANYPETAFLCEKERKDIFCTHRMRIEESRYSGWHVSKDTYVMGNKNLKESLALAMAEGRYFIPDENTKKQKNNTASVKPVQSEGLELMQYNDKCFALFGNTKPYKDLLGRNGLKCLFNGKLTNPGTGEKQAGWIVSNNKLDEVK